MLTQNQKERLSKLKTGKYAQILIDAEKVWKKQNIFPADGHFGLIRYKTKIFLSDSEICKCCIIGASLLGKEVIWKSGLPLADSMNIYYNISNDEMWAIIDGYDNIGQSSKKKYYPEAFNFGFSVRRALFINDCAV